MSDAIRTGSLLAATFTMGLVAGTFVLYAHTVMPGLRATDDRTFVRAFQSIDRAIINPWFMVSGFIGALGFTLIATIAHLYEPTRWWLIASLLLYAVAVVITFAVHVPINNAIKSAADADQDVAKVREQFDEARWQAWNLARVGVSVTAFGCLLWALICHGRATT